MFFEQLLKRKKSSQKHRGGPSFFCWISSTWPAGETASRPDKAAHMEMYFGNGIYTTL
jgi:hypothetical protein